MCATEHVGIPSNVEELLRNRIWVGKIRKAISQFYLNPHTRLEDDPEDTFADIIVKMLRRDEETGLDFVERYDAARATFGTYVFRMVNNTCIHKYNHRMCTAGKRLNAAKRLVPVRAPEEQNHHWELGEDELVDGRNWDPTTRLAIEQAVTALRHDFHAKGWVEVRADGVNRVRQVAGGLYEEKFDARAVPAVLVGTRWRRDPASVLQMLAMGFESWEIADLWGVSPGSVYNLTKKVRDHKVTRQALRPDARQG